MTKEENRKDYMKAYREANKEKIAAQQKAYKEANREKIAAQQKAYREANKEKELAWQKSWYEANREKAKAKGKAYYEANKEKIATKHKAYRVSNKEKMKAYREANKEKIASTRRSYINNRFKKDPVFKIKSNLRTNIINAFTRGGFTKKSKTFDILGCDWDTFINHITSQFTEGMTLENHGEWHLDHQVPLALAETEEESAELCYYTNYQPLWAKDNLQKNDKLRFDNISYSNKLRFIKYINRYEETNK